MKFVKKLTALFLAIVMTMAMGITAFAATTNPEQPKNTSVSSKETVKITIKNPVADHEYEVYQLLTGDVVFDANGNGKISNEAKGSGTDKTAAEVLAALKDSSGNWLSGGALSTAANGLLNKTVVDTLSTNKTSTTVTPGYYVIVDKYKDTISGDNVVFSRNMVAVVGDTDVTIKIETPSLDKKIVDPESDPNHALDASSSSKTDTAAIGDVINFEIKGSVPNYDGYDYYYYVINDTLSAGLTFDADSVKVYVGTSTTPLTKGTDYYLYTGDKADGKTFQIAFENIKGYTVGDEIKVTYNATLNENAVTGTDANTNTVNLTYSNNPNNSTEKDKEPGKPDSTVPTGKTPDKVTKTYTTELKLIKVDENNAALDGAEFTLTGTNLNEVKITTGTSYVQDENGTYWKLKDGSYTTDDPATEGMDQTKYESTTVKYSAKTNTTVSYTGSGSDKKISAFVGADGTWTFTGLNVGEYTLEETKVPAGYNKAANVKFEIKAEETGHADAETEGGSIKWSVTNDPNNTANVTYNATTKQFEVTIQNLPGSVLPTTGGMGTAVIYVAGIAMIVAAGVVVIVRKRFA